MVELKIKCNSFDEMVAKREEVHNGLAGSPAYIDSEIVLYDNDDTSFGLIIGNNNDHDVTYVIELPKGEKEKMNNEPVGIINEIGDLGLGFEPISEEEMEKIKKEEEKDK